MLKYVKVPGPFEPVFEKAEEYVDSLFETMDRTPEKGTVRIGGQRYVMMRCESLYLSWFVAMSESFGEEVAREFIYNTAREIGRSDSREFSNRLQISDGVERLSCGPVHFAHSGWAYVEIHDDSAPAMDEGYFLHYTHPNTFESEVIKERGLAVDQCACYFSAGYSAGWCSEAFQIDVHARELHCTAKGDEACEFIMAPADQLDQHEQRIRKA